jgi:hypothetical protein
MLSAANLKDVLPYRVDLICGISKNVKGTTNSSTVLGA